MCLKSTTLIWQTSVVWFRFIQLPLNLAINFMDLESNNETETEKNEQ